MDHRELDRTEEMLLRSLKEVNDKGEYNNVTLDIVGKTVDALKDICKIKEDNKSYGGHHGGEWTAEGTYGRMPYIRDWNDNRYREDHERWH